MLSARLYVDAPPRPDPRVVTHPEPAPGSAEARRRQEKAREEGGGGATSPSSAERVPDPSDFQFNPASGVAYREWQVVKTNELGRRQERVLGVDGTKIYNTKRDRKLKLITATFRPSRRIEDVLSLKILDNDRKSVRMTFMENGKQIVRDLEFETVVEAAHAVAKIRYIKLLLLENKRRLRPEEHGDDATRRYLS